ncbi:unnamed protein product [Caenorhabditis nigoni]
MIPFIFLFFLFSPSESCLKVNYPKCDCKFLAMDESNLEENSGKFYSELSSNPMKAPVITIEDCGVTAICEDAGFSLVVIDEDQMTTFGEYEATGFCNPLTQKWQISEDFGLKSFNRLNAVCIGQEKKCNTCNNMDEIIRDGGNEVMPISYEEKVNSDGCKTANITCSVADGWDCPMVGVWALVGPEDGHVITDQYSKSSASSSLTCNDDGQYSIGDLKPTSVMCITPLCTPKPTRPSDCCTTEGIYRNQGDEDIVELHIEDIITDGRCRWGNATCLIKDNYVCENVNIVGANDGYNMSINIQLTPNSASTLLDCTDEGYRGIVIGQLTDLWCQYENCRPA